MADLVVEQAMKLESIGIQRLIEIVNIFWRGVGDRLLISTIAALVGWLAAIAATQYLVWSMLGYGDRLTQFMRATIALK